LPVEAGQRAKGAHKSFLGCIFRVLPLTQKPITDSKDRLLIPADQHAIRLVAAAVV
jgi:hypothetical protein